MIKKPFTRFDKLLSKASEIAREAAEITTTNPVIETPTEDKTTKIRISHNTNLSTDLTKPCAAFSSLVFDKIFEITDKRILITITPTTKTLKSNSNKKKF